MHYPEMVKKNHRYRGPIESTKQNDRVRDVYASITILQNKFKKLLLSSEKMQESVYNKHNDDTLGMVILKTKSIKGGDI